MSMSTPHRLSVREAVGGNEIDSAMADTTSTGDPFEDFDVDSGSEKEFLIANLRNDAPKDEVEQFKEARKPSSLNFSGIAKQWDTTMNQKDSEETVRTAWVSDTLRGSSLAGV